MYEILHDGLERIQLEEVKKSIDIVLQYMEDTKHDIELDFSIMPISSDYEATNYLQNIRSKIDKKISAQLFNPVETFTDSVYYGYPTTTNSSSRMDEIEERVDKLERKTDDVRKEVHELLEEKMPRIDRVNKYLDSFEAEVKYSTDEDETN